MPLSAVMVPVIDFVAGLIVLVTILTVAGETPEPKLLLAPAVFVTALAITLGIGLWLSAIVVRYRDVSLVVPFLIQVTLFVTPILYPLSLIPDQYQALYSLNPLVGVLEAFRWTVLPGRTSTRSSDAGPRGHRPGVAGDRDCSTSIELSGVSPT